MFSWAAGMYIYVAPLQLIKQLDLSHFCIRIQWEDEKVFAVWYRVHRVGAHPSGCEAMSMDGDGRNK